MNEIAVNRLHKLYIGLNDKVTKKQIFPKEVAMESIKSALLYMDLDCTITTGQGIYTHDSGSDKAHTVCEETVIIEILDFGHLDFDKIKSVCEVVKLVLNQESIGYQVITLDKCELL